MKKKRWTCIGLSKKQICLLDEISKKCRFTGGGKLCRTSIVRAFLKAAGKLDIDVGRVRSEEEFRKRLLESFRNYC
jgi:hypothetical protein